MRTTEGAMTLALHAPDPAMKAAALDYARRGWPVLPLYPAYDRACGCGDPMCKSPGKHPLRTLVHSGLLNASAFAAHVERWWTQQPDANIAIRTGLASGLVVIDLDDKAYDGRDGNATWRRLLAVHADGATPETVEALTGGGGRHLLFQAPADLLIASSKDAIGPGIDVRAENGYIVAPPSTHVSGRTYAWDAFSHLDDTPIAPLPSWLLQLLRTRLPREQTDAGPRLAVTLDPFEVEELRSALLCLSSDDRDAWVQVGLALHSTNDDTQGFALWDQWSQTSAKYDEKDARRVWSSFKGRPDGLTTATIYHRATLAGWQRPTLEGLAAAAGRPLPVIDLRPPAHFFAPPVVYRPAAVSAPAAPFDAALPGSLETIADWSLATAPHPVRAYGVAAALALGSVLTARRYVTEANNYSSLYFLVVGKSGTGKEHVRKTIEDVLYAADASALVGPNKWTSDSAVLSGLLQAPQQVAVLDEFGQFLSAATGASDGATMRDTVLTQLMELYGRLHGRAQSGQYATHTLSPKQQKAAQRRIVDRPALTVVALTTPAAFYSALKSSRVASGFLNRFCVLEANTPRGDFAMPALDPVPDAVAAWARQLLAPTGDLDMLTRCTDLPDPRRLPITTDAQALFVAFRRECNAMADQLEGESLGELPMRSAEQSMRLALIATLADDPTALRVTTSAASWGIDVARWLLQRLVPAVQERMADSPLALLRKSFVAAVRGAGERGLSEYEIRRSALFAGVSRRDRDDVITWVIEARHGEWSMRPTTAVGGRPTRVLRIIADMTHDEAA
jgi:hypothetical protein